MPMRAGWFLLLCLTACGGDDPSTNAPTEAESQSPAPPRIPPDAPLVAFLGDSISAGLHLPEDEAFPAVLQRELAKRGKPFRLLNAGHSGDTTAGGLSRIQWLLQNKPDIVVVELGGNDGLRGLPIDAMRANLEGILKAIEATGAKTVLLGMRIPTSYGPEYTEAFAGVFADLATKNSLPFVPFFMEPIAGKPDLFLEDQLHPNPEGHRMLAEHILPTLEKVLK